jgi:hypothetical protein
MKFGQHLGEREHTAVAVDLGLGRERLADDVGVDRALLER